MHDTESHGSLKRVLKQTQYVMDCVQECAADLWSANLTIQREVAHLGRRQALNDAIAISQTVQLRVQEARDRLSVMKDLLEGQLRDRALLDFRLAAALEQEEAARRAALHDALTDLPNRALFRDRLEHGLVQARRHNWKLAVLFMDLDDFKDINDQHGHHIGDRVLQTVAQRAAGSIRAEDTVSRYGGDEFLYVFTDIQDEKWVAQIAEKIIEAVQEPYDILHQGVDVSLKIKASIGIAIYPTDGATPEALVKCADKAMYRAKESGNTYAFA